MAPEGNGDEGFTIIEVLVASFILVLGALAVFMTFAAGVHNVQRSREMQVGVSVAQREMERIRVEPYEDVGMDMEHPPTYAPNPTSPAGFEIPDSRLTPASPGLPASEFDLARETTLTQRRPLVDDGSVRPRSPEPGVVGNETAVRSPDGTEVEVFRFVTCEAENESNGECEAKRIVVDVLPAQTGNSPDFRHSYYELQSTRTREGNTE